MSCSSELLNPRWGGAHGKLRVTAGPSEAQATIPCLTSQVESREQFRETEPLTSGDFANPGR